MAQRKQVQQERPCSDPKGELLDICNYPNVIGSIGASVEVNRTFQEYAERCIGIKPKNQLHRDMSDEESGNRDRGGSHEVLKRTRSVRDLESERAEEYQSQGEGQRFDEEEKVQARAQRQQCGR